MAGLFDRLQTEIDRRERVEGISPMDLLELPADLRKVVQTLARRGGMTVASLATELALAPSELAPLTEALVDKGLIEPSAVEGQPGYRVRFTRRRAREIPFNIWDALADRTDGEAGEPETGGGAPDAGAPDAGGGRPIDAGGESHSAGRNPDTGRADEGKIVP